MILRLGYEIRFDLPAPVAMVALLHVHPSRVADLRAPDEIRIEPWTPVETFLDSFGNRCTRFVAQQIVRCNRLGGRSQFRKSWCLGGSYDCQKEKERDASRAVSQ
jgi:hypothetical protein